VDSQSRIQFAKVQKKAPWLDFICEHFALQREFALELRDLGALYLNQKRWFPSESEHVSSDEVVRVHLKPRRFPVRLLTQTRPVLERTNDWVLLWKPAGLPSHETLDNVIENCKAWAEREIGEKLWSLNRLDIGTRGWLLFAAHAEFARHFHLELQNHRVRKFYETLSPPPRRGPGRWSHWMRKSDRAPREVSLKQLTPEDLLCELDVLEWNPVDGGVHSRVELLTGRTHQIRAQFAFEGAPLYGDRLYGSSLPCKTEDEIFALSCERLEFEWRGRIFDFQRPTEIPPLPQVWIS
jgi:23S rRNA pseudouridine1911/1915/1917 synthase